MVNEYITILSEKVNSWLEALVAHLPNFLVALLIFLLFYCASKIVVKFSRNVLFRVFESHAITNIIVTVFRILILGLGFVVALGVLGLQDAVFSVLAGVGVVGLALGFAFQDLAANFISGIFLAFRRPFRVGDVIETNSYMGTVKQLNIRNTSIENFMGQIIIIPNKEIFENPLINYSTKNIRRVEIKVGVAYDSDLEKVMKLTEDTISKLDFCLNEEGIAVWLDGFGGSSIDFTIRFWIQNPGDVIFPVAKTKASVALKKAFDENDIEIPFPIRTIDFSMAEKQKINVFSKGEESTKKET